MSDLVRIALPFTVWLSAFSVVYGLQGLVCADAVGAGGRAWIVGAAAAAVVAQAGLVALLAAPGLASPRPFVRRTSVGLAVAALVTAAWTLLPAAVTSLCR